MFGCLVLLCALAVIFDKCNSQHAGCTSEMAGTDDVAGLKLERIIGFNGSVRNGLKVHPDGKHLVYPHGSTIIVEDITKDGVIAWDVLTGEAICGSTAHVDVAGNAEAITTSTASDHVLMTGGYDTLRIWELDRPNRKIRPTDLMLGAGIKRFITSIEMVKTDYFLCGTTTGDILVVNAAHARLEFLVPEKNKFPYGVTALASIRHDQGSEVTALASIRHDQGSEFMVGTGDGTLVRCKIPVNKNEFDATIKYITGPWKDDTSQAITSIALRGLGHQVFIGSSSSNIYKYNFPDSSCVLYKTCHSKRLNDVIFLQNTSELIATCLEGEIRVWQRGKEARRVVVAGVTCNALDATADGSSIISAWADGKIRVYGFNKKDSNMFLKFVVEDAHNKGVTAITCTRDGRKIVSGGGDGRVRFWNVQDTFDSKGMKSIAVLYATMKEHKGSVSAIKISSNEQECSSASTDGTCIIWSLSQRQRLTTVFADTHFQDVAYGLEGHHIVTCGTDRKIAYWNTLDGSNIRELEGAEAGAIYSLDMSANGRYFVSGGEEKLIKVWAFVEGVVSLVGLGHSAPITRVRICLNQKYIVSVSTDGAMFIWKFPSEDSAAGGAAESA